MLQVYVALKNACTHNNIYGFILKIYITERINTLVNSIPYFFDYNTLVLILESFSFQNNPKNLDPSYKMDVDL